MFDTVRHVEDRVRESRARRRGKECEVRWAFHRAGSTRSVYLLSLIAAQLRDVGLGRRSSTPVTHLAAPAHDYGAFTPHAKVQCTES